MVNWNCSQNSYIILWWFNKNNSKGVTSIASTHECNTNKQFHLDAKLTLVTWRPIASHIVTSWSFGQLRAYLVSRLFSSFRLHSGNYPAQGLKHSPITNQSLYSWLVLVGYEVEPQQNAVDIIVSVSTVTVVCKIIEQQKTKIWTIILTNVVMVMMTVMRFVAGWIKRLLEILWWIDRINM